MVERVIRFLTSPESASFEELALAAFAWQFERVEPLRRLCERRGLSPRTVTDWRQVPLVPTAAFKTLTLAAAPAVEVFRSSGTTARRGAQRPPPALPGSLPRGDRRVVPPLLPAVRRRRRKAADPLADPDPRAAPGFEPLLHGRPHPRPLGEPGERHGLRRSRGRGGAGALVGGSAAARGEARADSGHRLRPRPVARRAGAARPQVPPAGGLSRLRDRRLQGADHRSRPRRPPRAPPGLDRRAALRRWSASTA